MKRTKVDILPAGLTDGAEALFEGAEVYDSSCSPEARVYCVVRGDEVFYVKTAAIGSLSREADMTRYFHRLGLGAEVLDYESGQAHDRLITRRVPGEDLTHESYLSRPAWLCERLAECLRALHEYPAMECPGEVYLDTYLTRAEENYRAGAYDASHFPDSFGYRSAKEAFAVLEAGRHLLTADTLIHGDYCLPNVMFDGDSFAGFIDLGNSGIADRHIDLFWGTWSLEFNLHTNRFRERFLDAYGRERVSEDILRVVAAAEVFG